MGTPLAANEPGDGCEICWGLGKAFGDGVTPTVIRLQLTSQLPGEFFTEAFGNFLAISHLLEQSESSCRYVIESNGFRFRVNWDAGRTVVLITHLPTGHSVFSQVFAPECAVDIENAGQSPIFAIMFGGFANITWDLEGLQ